MASFSSNSTATSRIHALEKERQKRIDDVERRRENISAASVAAISTATAVANFAAPTDSVNNDLLATDTVGLVTHDDFKARRQNLERCAALEREKRENREAAIQHSRNRQTLEKRKRANKAVLSFENNSDSENSSEEDFDKDVPKVRCERHSGGGDVDGNEIMKRRRLGKDPSVDTKFLPDQERERAERAERERLKMDWLRKQEDIKNEMIRITYSYWDGSGHRRVISCKKGTTIGRFLAIVQTQFKQLRNSSPDSLMYIKEDLIIPHHYSFYDFVVMKARGKSGPLFSFDVVEDVRLVNDASREKEETHASKVVERRWYERNRHIFPASRWEVYDPTKKYDRYTIHGE